MCTGKAMVGIAHPTITITMTKTIKMTVGGACHVVKPSTRFATGVFTKSKQSNAMAAFIRSMPAVGMPVTRYM